MGDYANVSALAISFLRYSLDLRNMQNNKKYCQRFER